MSKPRKTDFMALIAGEVAPAVEEPVASAPQPAVARPRLVKKPAVAAGTLKTRARQLSVYLEPPVYDRLRDIAHEERIKLHPLILEAIDLLLRKRGAPSIRELTRVL
jgi:hypothetical protein